MDVDDQKLTIKNPKSGKTSEVVFIPKKLADRLKDYLKAKGATEDQRIFPITYTAARVFTVEDGWGWLFVAVEHWNAECVGWHVCKQGTRFAALEPISQGLVATVGKVTADAGRGLALRMDHGTQYLSDHFLNQLKHWGISPSFAFIEQPQTNGVAERFIRTMKEQVIYGRVFQNLEEVRTAVRRIVDTYNREWRVEKNGFLSPWQARTQLLAQASLSRAA